MPSFHLRPEFSGPTSATHGTCFFCNLGRQPRDPAVLATNVIVEEYHRQGEIEICGTCIGLMAGLFGYIAPTKAEQLALDAIELDSANKAAQKKIKGLESALDALRYVDQELASA